jgi:nucleoside-diphosphate-sugar epimerase
MKIVVTGGSGFLGQRLIRMLLARGELTAASGETKRIGSIIGIDLAGGSGRIEDARVRYLVGDLADAGLVREAIGSDAAAVFHLAAVVSGAAEADFDLGMRVNVDATRGLLEACRKLPAVPRFVFASSVAVFGGQLPPVLDDRTTPVPQTSYGAQKLIGELLVADYARKGFIDGRAARLPTIVVRPGAPNAAASSFASGIIREPLAGQAAICPVDRDTGLWLSSPEAAVGNLIHAHETAAAAWAAQPALNLPGITATVREMIEALRAVAGDAAVDRVCFVPDERISRIVRGWPKCFDTQRASSLGFARDVDAASLIRNYVMEQAR